MQYVWLVKEQFLNQWEVVTNIFLNKEAWQEAFKELKAFWKRQGYTLEDDDEDYFVVPWRAIASLEEAKIWQDVEEFIQTLQ